MLARTSLVAAVSLLALTGCNSIKERIAQKVADKLETETKKALGAPAASASITSASTTAPATKDVRPLIDVGPEAAPFAIVTKPSASDVPAASISGSANGHAFQGKAIWFEPFFEAWQLNISNSELTSPTGFTKSDAQTIHVSLPKNVQPKAGQKFQKALKYGDGFFQIVDPREGRSTTSWNTDNAYYLEITKWDVKPYDPKGSSFQVAGKASGKIYVGHKASSFASSGFKDSGVAGEFKDVVVRYMGKPKWVK